MIGGVLTVVQRGQAFRAGALLYLDLLNSTSLDSRITFSRTSQATLVDSTGKLTYAPNNLLLNSETFEAASWTKTNTTITSNAGGAPDGTTTADRFNATSPGGLDQSATLTSGVAYIISVWAKSNGASKDTFVLYGDGNQASSPFTATAAWQRFSYRFISANTGSRGNGIYTNGANAADILIWGAQLEQVTYQTTPGTYNSTSPKNLLGYTQEFDNAAWTKNNVSVTANSTAAPDGTTTADLVVPNTTGGVAHSIYASVTVAAATHVLSFYAKSGGYSAVKVGNLFTGVGASFNLATGAVHSTDAGVTATITAVGNGWYRCAVAFTASAGSTLYGVYVQSPVGTNSFAGDGTSGIYIWGAQLSNSASLDPYVYNPVAAPTSAAYYGPRFDYDPVTLANKGLLIEEQRTNLLTYSQQFDDVAWVKTAATVTANTVVSPDGSISADTLREDTTNAGHTAESASVSFTSGVSYTLSVYAKAATGTRGVCLRFSSSAFPTSSRTAFFSLASGTVVSNEAGTTASITNIGNGWYRCTMTATANATATVSGAFIIMTDASNNRVYTGDGTSSIYLFGAQLEAGSFATSYIPTIASQVTRTADVALMQGANFSNWYNQNAGTVFVDALGYAAPTVANGSAAPIAVSLYDTPATSQYASINIFRRDVATLNSPTGNIISSAGVAGADLQETAVSWLGASVKAAIAWNGTTDAAFSANGNAVKTDASYTLPVPDSLQIGRLGSEGVTGYWNGHIRRIGYYPTRLANAQLQSLTAQSTIPSLSLDFTTQVFNVG